MERRRRSMQIGTVWDLDGRRVKGRASKVWKNGRELMMGVIKINCRQFKINI
jgi:hypothetical protein